MFRKADESVHQTFIEMVEKVFPELSGYSFGLLFREKIKKGRGRVTLAEICLPSKLLSYYARNSQGNPYDFLMVIDEMVWAVADEDDRIRIVRHELRHVYIDEKGKCRLVGHDFEDFHEEVRLNADKPDWAARLVKITDAGYKQVKDGGNDPRVDRRDAPEPAVDKPRQVQIEAETAKTKRPPKGKPLVTVFEDTGSDDKLLDLEKKSKEIQERANSGSASRKLDDLARKRGLLANA